MSDRYAVVCDFCHKVISDGTYVDGATTIGPWANMCEKDFKVYGVGLGTGRGQRYDAKTGVKVEG